jgi:hypothetical protein
MSVQRNRAFEQLELSRATSLPSFWRSFLENGKNTRIIVPTPVFFGWGPGLIARDVNINDYTQLGKSQQMTMIQKELGKPSLGQQYVAASDAFASVRFGQYFDQHGARISLSTTADPPADILDRENVIVTGTPRTLAPFQNLLDHLSYQVEADKGEVFERNAQNGSPKTFETIQQSALRFSTPGVIACLPGGPSGTHVLVLVTTYYTSALASYLTSENGLRELEAAQHAHGDAPYFEAVVVSEINGTTELRSKLVEFHPLPSKNQSR